MQRVQRRERGDFLRRDREDGADQELLDVLGALRRAVEREHAERGRHRVDDADDRFLLDAALARARERKEDRAAERERERVPVGGFALHAVTGEDRDGEAERRHLREREIDEHDAAREHVQPEPGVDRREHEPRDEGPEQELRHGPARFSAAASLETLSSNRRM